MVARLRLPRLLSLGALMTLACCGPRVVRPDASADAASDQPPPDTLVIRVDRDGDGLCDDTEREARTDPDRVDTDGDGFTDGWEYGWNFSPLSATSPPSERQLPWSEAPGAPLEAIFTSNYRGNGEGVFGAFWDSPAGIDGVRGEELGLCIEALAAVPQSNAPDRVAERFVSVLGTTRLTFQLRGEWPARPALRCRRAYAIYPTVYAEGRGVISLRSFFLVVSASDASDDGGVEPDASAPIDGGGDGGAIRAPWPYVRDGLCLPDPSLPCR